MTTIYYNNCTVHTPDRPGEKINCFAVAEGKFAYVGTEDELLKTKGATKFVDFGGATVLPGLMDGHVHAPGLAYEVLFNLNLFQTKTMDEVLAQIKSHVDANPQKDIYYGRGVNGAVFGGEEAIIGPKKEHLDRISGSKPIIIADFGGNYIWMNTAAFQLYNIGPATTVPNGGEIPLDPNTGEAWGIVRNEARSLVPFQRLTEDENQRAALWFQDKMLSYGYTAVFALRPPGTVEPRTALMEVFSGLERAGKLKMRIFGARDIAPDADAAAELKQLRKLKKTYDSPLVKFTTAKFFLDGVVEGKDALLLSPYEMMSDTKDGYGTNPSQESRGLSIWTKDKLVEMFQGCMADGILIHCHTIGDGAVHLALDAVEEALARTGVTDHRTTLTHLQLVSPEDKKRMAALGVVANVQPYWHFKSPSLFEQVEKVLLGDRAESEYPLRSLLDQGVLLTASSDYPVTPEPNAFVGVQVACTRNLAEPGDYGVPPIVDQDDPRYLLNPDERAGVSDMIRAFTINNAFVQHGESAFGSIAAGKSADYILVDRDPYETPYMELGKIKILQTVFQSEVVYRKE